jgi:predicted 3-demethylubiquinone-9 3-methyltransferase (glyoxalase superfamily)
MPLPDICTALWFDSDAEAAARYYCTLFPDARIVAVHRQMGAAQGDAFIVEFTLMGQRFQAMNGGAQYRLTPAVSVSVLLDSQDEIDRLWAALLRDGGAANRCGWLTDRWGLSWQIVPRALPRLLATDAAGPVLQAMMGMVKLDIAALEAAAAGNSA